QRAILTRRPPDGGEFDWRWQRRSGLVKLANDVSVGPSAILAPPFVIDEEFSTFLVCKLPKPSTVSGNHNRRFTELVAGDVYDYSFKLKPGVTAHAHLVLVPSSRNVCWCEAMPIDQIPADDLGGGTATFIRKRLK